MRKLQIIALGICLLACACRSTNKLTDKDGNKYAVKEFANYLSITTNLQVNTAQSYCYADSNTYCQKYGRLYTWSAAQQACAAFGNGWRLPTQEEWQQLNAVYGNGPTDSITTRRAAYPVLLNGGSSGFNAVLGGGRDEQGGYARIDAHGFYWTATEEKDSMAVYYNFAAGSKALFEQHEGEKPGAFSVRCVKNK